MKVSEQQLLKLWCIAKDAANICGGMGGLNQDAILRLLNEILSQQDDAPVEREVTAAVNAEEKK